MNVKQKLYDLLGQHKAKVGEAQAAMEAGELDKAEALTKEAELGWLLSYAAARVSPPPSRRGSPSSRRTAWTAIRKP